MTETATVLSRGAREAVLGCSVSACAGCSGSSFCNIKTRTYTAAIPDNLEVSVGDEVEVYLPPGRTIFSGFIVLIVPLILFLVGFLLTGAFVAGAGEGAQALGGLGGLAVGFGFSYLFGKTRSRKYLPTVRKILSTKGQQPV